MMWITVASASGSALTRARRRATRRCPPDICLSDNWHVQRHLPAVTIGAGVSCGGGRGRRIRQSRPPKSVEDTRAALLAKAAAYKKAAEKDSKELGGKAELSSVIGETVKKLDEAKGQPAAPAGPPESARSR